MECCCVEMYKVFYSCFLAIYTKMNYSKILSLFTEMDLRLSCRLCICESKGHRVWRVKLRSHWHEVSVTCS